MKGYETQKRINVEEEKLHEERKDDEGVGKKVIENGIRKRRGDKMKGYETQMRIKMEEEKFEVKRKDERKRKQITENGIRERREDPWI